MLLNLNINMYVACFADIVMVTSFYGVFRFTIKLGKVVEMPTVRLKIHSQLKELGELG